MQKESLKLFWKFSNQHKIKRTLALIFPVIAVTVNAIAAPYVLSRFLDKLQEGSVTFANSLHLIIIYGVLIFVGEVILWRLALYFTWTFQINSMREVYLAVFRKLTMQDLNFHADRFGGSLVSQSSKLQGAFERFWDMIIWSIMPMLSTVIGSIIVLSVLGLWQYGIFLILYAFMFGIVVYFGSRFLTKRNREEAKASNATSGFLADIVTNINTVKAFGREMHEQKGADKSITTWHNASTHLKWGILTATSAFSTMYTIGAIGAFIFAVLSAESGIASAGMIYLVFIYALNINRQLWELNSITRTYNRVIGDADEMTRILKDDI